MHRPSLLWMIVAAVTSASMIAGSATAPAASSGVVVSMLVPSATNLATTGCAAGTAGRTDFGTVLPGATALTSLDCTIQFGSSNDTARLRVAQDDGRGLGMYQTSRGVLDTAFDTDGRVTTTIATGNRVDEIRAMAVQADGRAVVVGECDMSGATGLDFCLVRYNTNGSLDTTFDGDGKATTAFAPGTNADSGRGIALQPDGRIVAAGYCDMGGATNGDFCVARYNTNGSLDTTFDGDGRVTTSFTGSVSGDNAYRPLIQADGRIVVAGWCFVSGLDGEFCAARYNTDGSLDTSFDGDGRVTTSIGAGARDDFAWTARLQPDGRIVLAGTCNMGGSGHDFCAVRYNVDGSLDTSFDTDGRVTTSIAPGGNYDEAFDLAIQADGRLVLAGECTLGGANVDACVVRYNVNGSLDTSFDTDGRVTTATAPTNGFDTARAVAQQADGRIVTAGQCSMGGATGDDACLARYNSDGSFDTSFDVDGRVTTATAPGTGLDFARSMALQSDGRIVTAGYCNMGATNWDACLTQYDNAGSMSQYTDTVTDWDTVGTSFFGACLRSVTGGAPTWTTSATCPTTDGAFWNAVPATPVQIATATPNSTTSTADLRFGMRTTLAQPPGAYIAPITFDVLAP